MARKTTKTPGRLARERLAKRTGKEFRRRVAHMMNLAAADQLAAVRQTCARALIGLEHTDPLAKELDLALFASEQAAELIRERAREMLEPEVVT